MNDFVVANELVSDVQALRDQADRDGYLFFRGILPSDDLQNLRRQILELCRKHGWLESDSELMDGVARKGIQYIEGQPEFLALYSELIKLEDFHTLAHHPALISVLDELFGERTLVHARNIARIIFPQAVMHTTPAHQDYVHIQGTPETWTCWIPLGDCPKEQGSLAILPGSHKQGIYPTQSAYGAGGLGIDTESLEFEWAGSDFSIGDVVMFHSHTIHKGLPNTTTDRLRLSVDFRYQPLSHPVVKDSFVPHLGIITWEETYEGWSNSQFQYYWENEKLNYTEWSPEWHQAAGLLK